MVRITDATAATAMPALPMAGERRERGDAHANRERILDAARTLLDKHGPAGLTMQAVAIAAGVGKGTVFRRFGDRDGLVHALLDDYMRDFQDAFLHGPPPLGPGAPPAERLEAFVADLIQRLVDHAEFALAAEVRPGYAPSGFGTLLIHIRALVRQLDPAVDDRILTGFILSAFAPRVLVAMRDQLEVNTAALQAGARALLRGPSAPR